MDGVPDFFEKAYQERLTFPTKIDYPGIDYDHPDVREHLAKIGLSPKEVEQTIATYLRQQELIRREKNELAGQKLLFNSFSIAQLGWINCDRFYDDPQAEPVQLIVSLEGVDESIATSVSLIFNQRNLVLNGDKLSDGRFSLTRREEPYTKLPVGESVTLLALGMNDGKSYLAKKEMILPKEAEVQLSLEPHSQAEVQEIIGKM